MKDDQEQHHREGEEGLSSDTATAKRKMEDNILLAKQKAQEIAARLISNAESKRPRLADNDEASEPVPYSNSVASNTPFPVPFVQQTGQYEGSQAISKRMGIPNGKVGLIIGKGGETIKYLQSQSGAKIQITKDLEADPHSRMRDVELMGTSEQISRAEELISDMIAQSEMASSAPSANHIANTVQPGGEQFIIKVPNNKVALIIGKGGESIRTMQNKSGARIQIIPLHLPPGDTSTERNVYIDGLPEQIESAKELINEVISGKRIVNANSYMQPPYNSAGNWGAPGQPPIQQSHYGYTQPGSYGQPTQPAPYYSNYQTPATAWDQSNQSTVSQQPYQTAGYGYYGQQNQDGSAPPDPSYGYNQTIPTSHGYSQSYSQQPSSYGQPAPSQAPASDQPQPYASSGYGAPQPSNPDGTSSSESTQPPPTYPYANYGQPANNPHAGYWAYTSNTSQPPAQPHYDQSYYQTAYGQQQEAASTAPHSGYGADGYQTQSTAEAVGYDQAPNPPAPIEQHQEQQPQEQAATNGSAHSSGSGAQGAAGDSAGDGSAHVAQETGNAQS